MSATMTSEGSREAMSDIYAEAARGLDKAGATQESGYKVIARVQDSENDNAALNAVKLNFQLRGKLREKQEVEHSGNVVFEIVDYADKGNGKRKTTKRKGGNGSKN